jgi:hypothetical protein
MRKQILGIALFLVLIFFACKKEAGATYDCTGLTPTYTNDIKSIVNSSCAIGGCHNAASRAEGIDLSTYAKVKSESGKDRFLGAIEHRSGYEAMPQGASKFSEPPP